MTGRAARPLLIVLAGPTVWAIGFSALYGLQALICAHGWPARPLLIALWAAHLLVLAAIAGAAWRQPPADLGGRLLRFLARILSLTGLVATIWTGLPIVTTSACR